MDVSPTAMASPGAAPHPSRAPARALLVSVGSKLRNVFPCEFENRYVEPEDFLESLLKREPWAVGGVERRKRVKRHDRLADHLAANPDLLEPGLTLHGKERPNGEDRRLGSESLRAPYLADSFPDARHR
jgi:hypothetical protein